MMVLYVSIRTLVQALLSQELCYIAVHPDLLRYCNSSNAVVTGLFSYCGHDVQSSAYGHDFSKNDYGLHGRIPPYLLYPLKSSTDCHLIVCLSKL